MIRTHLDVGPRGLAYVLDMGGALTVPNGIDRWVSACDLTYAVKDHRSTTFHLGRILQSQIVPSLSIDEVCKVMLGAYHRRVMEVQLRYEFAYGEPPASLVCIRSKPYVNPDPPLRQCYCTFAVEILALDIDLPEYGPKVHWHMEDHEFVERATGFSIEPDGTLRPRQDMTI